MLLNYDDVGPGPVVVLLHGFPFDNSMWNFQKEEVGGLYRVITPDLRGHGGSIAPEEPLYSVDTMADDVIETIEGLGIEGPVILGGLSMGGYVALSIAARYPTRLRALMLMDTRAAADTDEARRNRLDLAERVESAGSAAPAVEAMLPKLFAPWTIQNKPDLYRRIESKMSEVPAHSVAATLRGLADRPDRTADLTKIVVPTLVLVGADDALTPPDEARAMASAIPSSRMVEVPNAGHLAPLENPEAVNRTLLDFLKDVG